MWQSLSKVTAPFLFTFQVKLTIFIGFVGITDVTPSPHVNVVNLMNLKPFQTLVLHLFYAIPPCHHPIEVISTSITPENFLECAGFVFDIYVRTLGVRLPS